MMLTPQLTASDCSRWFRDTFDVSRRTLAFLAFTGVLLYGVGDSVTTGLLLERVGVESELNPIGRFVWEKWGTIGLVVEKAVGIPLSVGFVWGVARWHNIESRQAFAYYFSLATVGGALATVSNLIGILSTPQEAGFSIVIVAAPLL